MLEFRLMEENEIQRMREIDRTEVIEDIYYFREGKLEMIKEYCEVSKWSNEQIQGHISTLIDNYNT